MRNVLHHDIRLQNRMLLSACALHEAAQRQLVTAVAIVNIFL